MNWEQRAAAAIKNRSDAHVLRERADVVVRYLLGRQSEQDPDLEQALTTAGVDAERARPRCREMLDTALFTQSTTPRDVLGVSASASHDEVRNQYKRLVQLYHPDRDSEFDSDLSSDRLTRLRQAQDAVLDPASAADTRTRTSRAESDPTGARRRRSASPQESERESNRSASGYDQGAQQASPLSTSGHASHRRSRTRPGAKEKLLQRLGQKHRPQSAQISFFLFVFAGIAGVFYFLVNDPCSVKGDCDPASPETVIDERPLGVVASGDTLLAYPDIRTLLATYSNALKSRNMALLTQQFAPDVQHNELKGLTEVREHYQQLFDSNPGPREFEARTIHENDDGVFSIEGTMTDHSTDGSGKIQVAETRFLMQVKELGGKLRMVNFRYMP